jgi:hypothetical protein
MKRGVGEDRGSGVLNYGGTHVLGSVLWLASEGCGGMVIGDILGTPGGVVRNRPTVLSY